MCVVTFDWEENDAKEKFRTFIKKKTLSWAVLDLTDHCNFNCAWCYASTGASSGFERVHMPISDVKRIVGILSDAGVRQITYSGGEPTLYPRIKEAVRIAREAGLIVHMNTNGYLLTRSLAKELKALGLSQVQINIDSVRPERHDRVRGKRNSFERALKALRNAREAGITCVSQTVVTKENENEVIDIFRLARSIGVQRCRVWDMTPEGYGKGKDEMMPTDYVKTLLELAEFAKETGAIRIESGDPLFPGRHDVGMEVSFGFCVSIHGTYTAISCRGDVYPCAADRVPLYNILRDSYNNLNEFHRMKLHEYIERSISPLHEHGDCYIRLRSS